MTTKERARAMRADGLDFSAISKRLGCSLQHAYRVTGDTARGTPQPTERTIVRHFPHNGGCSTQSGMRPVSLPRIVALHGVAA